MWHFGKPLPPPCVIWWHCVLRTCPPPRVSRTIWMGSGPSNGGRWRQVVVSSGLNVYENTNEYTKVAKIVFEHVQRQLTLQLRLQPWNRRRRFLTTISSSKLNPFKDKILRLIVFDIKINWGRDFDLYHHKRLIDAVTNVKVFFFLLLGRNLIKILRKRGEVGREFEHETFKSRPSNS